MKYFISKNGNNKFETCYLIRTNKSSLEKQRLVLTTGDKLLISFGPDIGFIFTPKQSIVIASESVVAHDMVSLAWMLYKSQFAEGSQRKRFRDSNGIIAKFVNIIVVKILSRSWKKAIKSKLFTLRINKNQFGMIKHSITLIKYLEVRYRY